jgi:hypothetical protein
MYIDEGTINIFKNKTIFGIRSYLGGLVEL